MTHGSPTVRRWRNRDLVRERDPHHARRVWRLVVAVILATLPVATYLVQQNECLKLSYRANALRAENEKLVERERRLRVERATLEAPDAIERWALGPHGMVLAAPERIVVVGREAFPAGDLLARDASYGRRSAESESDRLSRRAERVRR